MQRFESLKYFFTVLILLFLIRIYGVDLLRFIAHLLLLFGDKVPDALYLVRILDTVELPTPTAKAISLTYR